MKVLRVFELIPRRALVARVTAQQIASHIEEALREANGAVELDFSNIDAVTPSFVDEILNVIQSTLDRTRSELDRVVVSNSPTRLSSKFLAIGRGRHLHIAEGGSGTWIITPEIAQSRS